MTTTVVLFLVGLVLLAGGGELLVRSASNLATGLGVSRLFIGLTVVAFGTSAPEAVVAVVAALRGSSDLALGNVIGSNIFNVLFILGLSALIVPLAVSTQLVRFDVPLMAVVSVLMVVLCADGEVNRLDGVLLLAGLGLYTWLGFRLGQKAASGEGSFVPQANLRGVGPRGRVAKDGLLVLVSLGLLVVGSRWLVDSATEFARWLGLSDMVIGLTIVAAGTSLPEVATSVMAALRGERDIAVGNVVGSNITNVLGVLGLSAVVAPTGVQVPGEVLVFDLPVMAAVGLLCLPVFFSGMTVSRWEGGVLLGYFVLYTAYVLLRAAGHATLPTFTNVVGWVVLPLTLGTILLGVVADLRRRHGSRVPV
jgi:cation:H+ antiporter